MLRSGDVLDLSDVPGVKVDKHSTGGVGDKVSICPRAARRRVRRARADGLAAAASATPAARSTSSRPSPASPSRSTPTTFRRIVRDVGTCMIGQTDRIAPADKRIYALRDVTATVESIPLIVASILSKKLAEGIDALVLDVKVGRGAFMKTERDARALGGGAGARGHARGQEGGRAADRHERAARPRGRQRERDARGASRCCTAAGPADLVECTLALGERDAAARGRRGE